MSFRAEARRAEVEHSQSSGERACHSERSEESSSSRLRDPSAGMTTILRLTAQDDSLPGCRRFLICPLRGHPRASGGPLGMTSDGAALGTPPGRRRYTLPKTEAHETKKR